eukprot:3184035-Prymnesium_polylepis.1
MRTGGGLLPAKAPLASRLPMTRDMRLERNADIRTMLATRPTHHADDATNADNADREPSVPELDQ